MPAADSPIVRVRIRNGDKHIERIDARSGLQVTHQGREEIAFGIAAAAGEGKNLHDGELVAPARRTVEVLRRVLAQDLVAVAVGNLEALNQRGVYAVKDGASMGGRMALLDVDVNNRHALVLARTCPHRKVYNSHLTMTSANTRRTLLLSFLALAVVATLAYLRPLFLDETFAVRDHLTHTLPSRSYLAEQLGRGHFPEWWDGLRLGERFAADPNNGVTYPLAWLVALLGPLWGADFILILHVWLAGVGTLLLARRLGASALGGLLAGCALMLSGYMTSMVVSGSILMPLGWMPLLAWASLGLAQTEGRQATLRRGLIFALILSGSVAAGNPAGFNSVVLAVALVALTARRRWTSLLVLGAAGALGVLMGATSLIVAAVSLGDNSRGAGFSLADAGAWSLHPLRLLELVWPNVLGQGFRPERCLASLWASGGGALEATWSASLFMGAPVLLCAALAVWRGERLARRLAVLSLVFVVLAFGTFTPVYGLYRSLVWPERLLRYPEKHIAGALILWAALAGVGFDRLFDSTARKYRALLGAAVAACLALGFTLATLGRGHLLSAIASASQAAHKAVDGPAALSDVLAGGLSATAVAALLPLTVLLAGHRRFGRWARPLLLLALVVQLIDHGWTVQVTIPREVVRTRPAVLQPLPPPEAGQWPRLLRHLQDVTPLSVSAEARATFLHHTAIPNDGARFGFAQIPAYVIAGTGRFDAFAAASGRSNLERVMDVLDIRYLLIDVEAAPAMGMPVRSPTAFGSTVVLENPERRPRAFVAYRWRHGLADQDTLASLFDTPRSELDLGQIRLAGPGSDETQATEESTPCSVKKPQAEHAILDCKATRAGYAVLLDEWTHGWTATVDGVASAIERADVLARAVPVPAGEHRIEMHYRTPGLRPGLWLTMGGWLIFGLLLVCERRARKPGQGPDLDRLPQT